MDRRERAADPEETLRMAFESMLSGFFFALPCIIDRVNSADRTVDVKPTIKGLIPQKDGTSVEIEMPILSDLPVQFPGGGGAFLEFPLAKGDEVLAIFSSRSIDLWWALGGVQSQSESGRMHNLSDGFCIPRVWSKSTLTGPFDSKVRLRNEGNDAYMEFDPVAKSFNFVAPGGMTLNGMTIDHSANVASAGNIASTGIVSAATAVKVGGVPLTVP